MSEQPRPACLEAGYVDAFMQGAASIETDAECPHLETSNMWEAWHVGRHAASKAYDVRMIHKSRGSTWLVGIAEDEGVERWIVSENGDISETRA